MIYITYNHVSNINIFSQNSVLEILFRSVKCMAVTRICKNCEQLFKAITACRCKQTTSRKFYSSLKCIYFFIRIYNLFVLISITLLLTNNITKICSEKLKFERFHKWLILAMWKDSTKMKRWLETKCTLHRLSRSSFIGDERL